MSYHGLFGCDAHQLSYSEVWSIPVRALNNIIPIREFHYKDNK